MTNYKQEIKALIYETFPNIAIKYWEGFWEAFKDNNYAEFPLNEEVDDEDNLVANETVAEYILVSFGYYVCNEA